MRLYYKLFEGVRQRWLSVLVLLIAAIVIIFLWRILSQPGSPPLKLTPRELVRGECAALCAQWRGGGCPYQDWNTWLVESDCIGKVDYMNKSYWCGSEPNLTDMGFGDCEKTEILSPNVKYERIVHYECPCLMKG